MDENLPAEITKLKNRAKTVRSAQLLLLAFAFKPILIHILTNLNAGISVTDISFRFLDCVETVVPVILAILWFIFKSWRWGYISAIIIVITFVLAVNNDESILSTTPILGCYIFVVCICLSGAQAGRLIARIRANFPELYDLYKEHK